jgi:uncharacterized protein YidB (DUF937 family)
MSRFLKIGLGIFAVVAVAGSAVGFVSAQTDGDGSASGDHPGFIVKLAENLGISVDTLEQAIRDTQLDQLDEAVADGRVPEDRAAEIRERIESGGAPLFPFGRGPGHHHGGIAAVRQTAEFLGLEPQDVLQALQDGGTLASVAVANGKTAGELSSYLYDQLKSRLDQAVQSGRITQAQEDTILSNAQARIDQAINRVGPFFGGPHGFPQDGDAPDGLPMTPGDGSAPQEDGLFF